MSSRVIYEIEALTDLWTGDWRGEAGRLVTTGLLGSIRWWFEVVLRGLGDSACDPSQHQCPAHGKRPHEPGHHCVVCELFGCTGWARKFRFDVLDSDGTPQRNKIKKGSRFRLSFTPLRPVRREEWALLDLTLRLIAEHGAIGGKTVYKPSDERGRASRLHHQDYGLIRIASSPSVDGIKSEQIRAYVGDQRWRTVNNGDFTCVSLTNFWCVPGRYLARQASNRSTFNRALGRKETKSKGQPLRNNAGPADQWLAGNAGKQSESKKIFSFKDSKRTFGFVKPGVIDFAAMRQRLKKTAWPGLEDQEFVEGPALLRRLLGDGSGATP